MMSTYILHLSSFLKSIFISHRFCILNLTFSAYFSYSEFFIIALTNLFNYFSTPILELSNFCWPLGDWNVIKFFKRKIMAISALICSKKWPFSINNNNNSNNNNNKTKRRHQIGKWRRPRQGRSRSSLHPCLVQDWKPPQSAPQFLITSLSVRAQMEVIIGRRTIDRTIIGLFEL